MTLAGGSRKRHVELAKTSYSTPTQILNFFKLFMREVANDNVGCNSSQGSSLPQDKSSTPEISISINGDKNSQTQVKQLLAFSDIGVGKLARPECAVTDTQFLRLCDKSYDFWVHTEFRPLSRFSWIRGFCWECD
ncbi:unnamed protein product, partial [Allacma fusca]